MKSTYALLLTFLPNAKNKMIIFISFLTFVASVCDPSSPTFGNCVDEALQAAGDRIVALESVNNLLIGKVTSLENENKAIKSELNDLKADIISLETFEEIFEEIDDTLKEQNSRIETVKGLAEDNQEALNVTKLEMDTLKASNDLLNNQYNVLDSKIKAVEARLDILEGDAGTDFLFNFVG